VNQFERYALENNSEKSRHSALQAPRPGLFRLVDRFRRKRRNIVAYPHILRIGAEAQQLRIGPAPMYLFDDCLERTFIAKVPGAEVSVKAILARFGRGVHSVRSVGLVILATLAGQRFEKLQTVR
jgi:hypothetical protein